MKIFYYTATGNSLSVAKELGGELYSIVKVMKGNEFKFKDEKIGIICPCYGGGVPEIVKEFLEKVTLESPYIFAISSYGFYTFGVSSQFQKIAKKNGVNLSYINNILMVNGAINFFEMKDQQKKVPKKNIEEQLNRIKLDINNKLIYKANNSIFVKALTNFMQVVHGPEAAKKEAKKFIVESHCNSCETCAKVCPVNNIKVNNKPEFYDKCLSCFSCTHNCPQNAIRHKGEKSKERFRNPKVSLKEIIDANS